MAREDALSESEQRDQALTVVLVTTAVQMVLAMSNLVLPTIAPAVAQDLGVDPAWVGYQVSLVFGAAALSTGFGGTAVLRWGAGRISQVSVSLCLLGVTLFVLPHLAFIALGSVAIGISMGLANPAGAHLLVRYTAPERRNLVFSVKQTGVPVGGVLVALTAPALALAAGWRWSLAMLGVAALLLMAAMQPHRAAWDGDRNPAGSMRQTALGGVPLVWRQHSLRWISLAALLYSAIQRCLLTFTVIYLVAERGYGLIEAGIMLSVTQVAGSVSRIGWGWLADRTGSSLAVLTVICVVMIGSSAALTALDASWPGPLVYLLFALLGTSALGWNGVYHAECARLSPPGMVSLVAGGTAFFVYAGVLFGPSAFAAAHQVIGAYSATFGLLVAAAVIAQVLLMLAGRAVSRAVP
jgi:MFS family permease